MSKVGVSHNVSIDEKCQTRGVCQGFTCGKHSRSLIQASRLHVYIMRDFLVLNSSHLECCRSTRFNDRMNHCPLESAYENLQDLLTRISKMIQSLSVFSGRNLSDMLTTKLRELLSRSGVSTEPVTLTGRNFSR